MTDLWLSLSQIYCWMNNYKIQTYDKTDSNPFFKKPTHCGSGWLSHFEWFVILFPHYKNSFGLKGFCISENLSFIGFSRCIDFFKWLLWYILSISLTYYDLPSSNILWIWPNIHAIVTHFIATSIKKTIKY